MAKSRKVYSERFEQRLFVRWFRLQYPNERIAKFNNEGQRTLVQTQVLKLEGLWPGVPDLMVFAMRKSYGGLLIEMKKTVGGVISEQQAMAHVDLNGLGYLCVVCYGWESAMEVTKAYMDAK